MGWNISEKAQNLKEEYLNDLTHQINHFPNGITKEEVVRVDKLVQEVFNNKNYSEKEIIAFEKRTQLKMFAMLYDGFIDHPNRLKEEKYANILLHKNRKK